MEVLAKGDDEKLVPANCPEIVLVRETVEAESDTVAELPPVPLEEFATLPAPTPKVVPLPPPPKEPADPPFPAAPPPKTPPPPPPLPLLLELPPPKIPPPPALDRL